MNAIDPEFRVHLHSTAWDYWSSVFTSVQECIWWISEDRRKITEPGKTPRIKDYEIHMRMASAWLPLRDYTDENAKAKPEEKIAQVERGKRTMCPMCDSPLALVAFSPDGPPGMSFECGMEYTHGTWPASRPIACYEKQLDLLALSVAVRSNLLKRVLPALATSELQALATEIRAVLGIENMGGTPQ
jgi:hypothetical protein